MRATSHHSREALCVFTKIKMLMTKDQARVRGQEREINRVSEIA